MSSGSDLHPIRIGTLNGLIRRGADDAVPYVVLLHGYGGDERAMWIFSQGIPAGPAVIALQGLYAAPEGGYRWHVGRRWPPPAGDVLLPAVEALREATGSLGDRGGFVWIGFSQGAAVAFQCAASGLATRAVVCLAGYLPESIGLLPPRVPVFWAHGTRDDRVPIEAARNGAEILRGRGAEIEFCEAEVGHKLGAGCLRVLRAWMERQLPTV